MTDKIDSIVVDPVRMEPFPEEGLLPKGTYLVWAASTFNEQRDRLDKPYLTGNYSVLYIFETLNGKAAIMDGKFLFDCIRPTRYSRLS